MRAPHANQGALRLMLVLTAGCGLALAFLLLRQRDFFQHQRHLLQELDLARSNLNRGTVRLLVSSSSHDAAEFQQASLQLQHVLLSIRQGYQEHHYDPSRFESRVVGVMDWLVQPHGLPLQAKDIEQGTTCLRQLDLEAERLHDLSSLDFMRRDAALGREISGFLWLLTLAFSGSALLVRKLWREEQDLASKLAESESQLKLVVDDLPQSFLYQFSHGPDGQYAFHYASSGFQQVHGISSEQLLRDSELMLQQVPAHQLQAFLKAEVANAARLSDFSHELQFRRPDGATRQLSLRCHPRLLPDGGILWNGLATDVTESRRLEARYRDLIENAFEGIFQTRPDGRFLAVNPSMARAFGYSSPEVMLDNLKSAYELYAVPAHREEFVRLLRLQGRVQDFEFEGLRQDGSHVWISTNARAVRTATGEVDYYEGTGLDITERKQAFERIRHLNRVYAVRTDINQTIVRGASPQEVFEAVCQVTVQKGNFLAAAIATLGPQLAISASAGFSLPESLLQSPGHCPVLGAALAGVTSVENDLQQLDDGVGWKEQALRQGSRSIAVLPIRVEGQISGLLVLFSEHPGFFDADEIGLLKELAADISFAVSVYHREQKRLTTEEELRVSQEHFRQAEKRGNWPVGRRGGPRLQQYPGRRHHGGRAYPLQ